MEAGFTTTCAINSYHHYVVSLNPVHGEATPFTVTFKEGWLNLVVFYHLTPFTVTFKEGWLNLVVFYHLTPFTVTFKEGWLNLVVGHCKRSKMVEYY
jgi:hypothetical protein